MLKETRSPGGSENVTKIHYNLLPRGIHGETKRIGVYCVGVEGRANELGEPTETRGCGSFSAWQVERRVLRQTKAHAVGLCP
jgi:hypothetical protein